MAGYVVVLIRSGADVITNTPGYVTNDYMTATHVLLLRCILL
ncbi:hypothetical protein HRbin02_00550 [Candidatus Calditenuaceae archaeon HR02]|nr:hypothetical protein HRbin02_00550 [Candidatus Calditenuaceae archaeon HR02]